MMRRAWLLLDLDNEDPPIHRIVFEEPGTRYGYKVVPIVYAELEDGEPAALREGKPVFD